MIFIKQIKIYYLFFISSIILIDQYTKFLIFDKYNLIVNKDYFFFKLELVKNYGAAFNLFSGSRIFLSFVSIFISGILFYLLFKKNSSSTIELYAYSFILGGSIGNGIDRVQKGFVIDFINLNFIDFPVFNIADISINIGFILLIYFIFKNNR